MKTALVGILSALYFVACGGSQLSTPPPEDAAFPDTDIEAKLDLGVNGDEKPTYRLQCGEYGFGPKDACILMEWYGDFEGPFDKRFYDQTFPLIMQNHGRDLCLEYKHFPLTFHLHAQKAAEASECAKNQNHFWDYLNILFEKWDEWRSLNGNTTPEEAISFFKDYATRLKLNRAQFDACLDSGAMVSRVDANFQEGLQRGVQGVPWFFLNGSTEVTGAQPYSAFEEAINAELKNCPP